MSKPTTTQPRAKARRASPSPRSSAAPVAAADQPDAGFQYSRGQFQALVEAALSHAKKLGATDAGADASEGSGLSVSVRKGELENVERNRDKSLGVTVYLGHRRGNASTSDFSLAAVRQTVQAAFDIARFTAEDPFASLPEPEDVATEWPELDLFHPWALSSEEALALALRCENSAFATSKQITNSEGAGVSAQQSHFFSAHMRGGRFDVAGGLPGVFSGGYASSRHSLSVAPIAGKGAKMQRDHWYSSMRDAADLASPEAVGRYAAERALARLNGRKLDTTQCPVLFESTLAAGLLGGFVQAVSGGAQYRKTTFLLDSLGKQVFPRHIDVLEDPHVVKGKGSSPFDDEGVRTQARKVVSAGRVKGYFLSSYSARKLGMKTTGNAGGSHNLTLTSRQTQPGDDLPEMLRKLGTGLFVTELMGQGVNGVTGDYSRGASGYWVENGVIAYPVEEITIAGNLKDMLKGIEAVGADAYNYGAKTVGSILINRMKVAGN
jgi:PmbA protein